MWHHPNIVKVKEEFDENNTTYYTMEFIDGETNDYYIKKNGILSEDEFHNKKMISKTRVCLWKALKKSSITRIPIDHLTKSRLHIAV